jgi:preprotein translocase SecF subunit
MQILVDTNFDFMGKRRIGFIISGLALLIAIGSLVAQGGPRLSIDFTGGTFVQLSFTPEVMTEELRDAVGSSGINAEIQRIKSATGSEYIIRMKNEEVAAVAAELLGTDQPVDPFAVVRTLVQERRPEVEATLQRQETVGPKIGSELRDKAIQAVLVALVLMLIYIAFRFHGFFYAFGAVAALFHDVLIVLGVFSILRMEVSLTILAALLTIAGYSINDTIVVFDRIREQLKLLRRESLDNVINISINKTLSRTVLTSITTMFAVVSLWVWGGSVIHDFAFAVMIGVLVGTYSSIFVASTVVLTLNRWAGTRERKSTTKRAGKQKATATG